MAHSSTEILAKGVALAGGADSLTLASDTQGLDSGVAHGVLDLHLLSGIGAGQSRPVLAYDAGTKVARVAPWDAEYLSLPGTAGNYASTPDSAAVSITGDIDLRARIAANDWTPSQSKRIIAKRSSGQFSFDWALETTGILVFFSSADGTNQVITALSTAAVDVSDGAVIWVRITVDVDNGAGGRDIKFWTSNDGVAWTQLGATVTQAGTTSFFNGTAGVWVGELELVSRPFAGKVYYAEIRNGIDGSVVAKFDPANDASAGDVSFTASTGEVWTVNQSGSSKAELTSPGTGTEYEVRHVLNGQHPTLAEARAARTAEYASLAAGAQEASGCGASDGVACRKARRRLPGPAKILR